MAALRALSFPFAACAMMIEALNTAAVRSNSPDGHLREREHGLPNGAPPQPETAMLRPSLRRFAHSGSKTPLAAGDNLRASLAVLAGMALFICNDTLTKTVSDTLPTGQIITLRSAFALAFIVPLAFYTGALRDLRAAYAPAMIWRNIGEAGGVLLYLTALFNMPIANATAIMQVLPLAITAGAALFLGERVGWRRWLAAGIGLIGVLIIIKPGHNAFNAWSLAALIGVFFIVLRDLATRRLPTHTPTLYVTTVTAAVVTVAGLGLGLFETWMMPRAVELLMLAGAALFVLGGYAAMIYAMRAGEVSAIAPFRYSIILWAIAIGYVVWGDVPTLSTLLGIAIVVGAGLYTFYRERTLERATSGGQSKAGR
ncbi:MAG: DMT family transporter [Pseudomonadota bacterium]